MANKCAKEGCTYLAVTGELFCIQHRAAKVNSSPKLEDGFAFVEMTDVPANARYNEKANKLFAAMKTAAEGKALKISLKQFKNGDLLCAQRYARAAGVRLGVRFAGEEWAYLWKMTDAEIKTSLEKGERLRKSRKGKK